jgi:hypothetical protein
MCKKWKWLQEEGRHDDDDEGGPGEWAVQQEQEEVTEC